MKRLIRALFHPVRSWHRIERLWNRWRFLRTETRAHVRLQVGRNVTFYVPVRSGGCGTLVIGDDNNFGVTLAPRLGSGAIVLQPRSPEAEIVIGAGNWFNNNTAVCAQNRVTIGNGCQIGDLVVIQDFDGHEVDPATRNRSPGQTKPVHIGNNVWLGSRVMVLKGVTIGDNSVIGAMSVVTKSIPANCVAAGNPASVIRTLA